MSRLLSRSYNAPHFVQTRCAKKENTMKSYQLSAFSYQPNENPGLWLRAESCELKASKAGLCRKRGNSVYQGCLLACALTLPESGSDNRGGMDLNDHLRQMLKDLHFLKSVGIDPSARVRRRRAVARRVVARRASPRAARGQ